MQEEGIRLEQGEMKSGTFAEDGRPQLPPTKVNRTGEALAKIQENKKCTRLRRLENKPSPCGFNYRSILVQFWASPKTDQYDLSSQPISV